MEQIDIFEILNLSIGTILWASMPVIIGALIIGLFVALFQALTHVQEMTLTFVPKIIGILIIMMFSMPYMYRQLQDLADVIFDTIVSSPL